MRAALLLIVLASPGVVRAQAAPTGESRAVPADPASDAAALKLATALHSEAMIIGDAASDAKAVELADELMRSDKNVVELERRHPGIARQIATAVMPLVHRSSKERLPELWRRQAALYRANFTAAELGVLIEFYTSPTGQKLIATTMREVRPDAMMREAKASPDYRFSADATLKDIRAIESKLVDAMGPQDRAALQKFGASGLAPRLQKLAPATQKIAIDWGYETSAWEDAAMQTAIDAVIDAREKAGK